MKIVKLVPSKRVEGRWLVWLEDGDLLRVSGNEVAAFGLYADQELDGETLSRLRQAADESALRSRALDALTARPMSRRELVDRLTAPKRRRREEGTKETEDGASALLSETLRTQADAVADRLEELGLLDDRAYAKRVAEHYAGKGWGARKIRDELYRRGVPREYWDEALDQMPPPDDAIDQFLEKKLRGWSGDPKELKRASDALARRGFSWQDISAALRRYGAETED